MALEFKGDVVSSLASTVSLPRMVRVKQLLDHSHSRHERRRHLRQPRRCQHRRHHEVDRRLCKRMRGQALCLSLDGQSRGRHRGGADRHSDRLWCDRGVSRLPHPVLHGGRAGRDKAGQRLACLCGPLCRRSGRHHTLRPRQSPHRISRSL